MPVSAPDEGLVSMELPTNNAFLYSSAPCFSKVGSTHFEAVGEMGKALASSRMAQIQAAMRQAAAWGLDASEFCYKDQNGQFFTPILALMARRTKNHMTRALSLIKAGPGKGMDLSLQKCWVPCAEEGGANPVLLGMEQASPALLGLYVQAGRTNSSGGGPLPRAEIDEFFQSMDKWSIDWNGQSETGLTGLIELVRRVPLDVASIVVAHLEARGADPLLPDDMGCTALDYLDARLSLSTRKNPAAASAGEAISARWKSLRLSHSLPGESTAPRSRAPRL